MQRTGEGGEEGFGRSISAQPLRNNLARHGADIEDVTVLALPHLLSEEVTEHSRSVHVQVEDKHYQRNHFYLRAEGFAQFLCTVVNGFLVADNQQVVALLS